MEITAKLYLNNGKFVITQFVTTVMKLKTMNTTFWREKEGNLTQSYDKTLYTNRKFENQRTTHERHQNLRLHNNCGPT